MRLDTHTVQNNDACELYLTVSPTPNIPVQAQARDIFSAIANELNRNNATILQERVFANHQIGDILRTERASAYGDCDDGVDPTWLTVPDGINGQISAVQVHAIRTPEKPEIVYLDDKPCGRIVTYGQKKLLAVSGICGDQASTATEQALQMLQKAESILNNFATDMLSVARTWMWLKDILQWYDDFNDIRNKFFIQRGLIKDNGSTKMPASTGIGIGPASRASCAMDLISVFGPNNEVGYLDETDAQKSAYDYGSAFSRATKIDTPASNAVYVSGTASIDLSGATVNVGDPQAQIQETIDNVLLVLKSMDCGADDIVQAILYCKTAEIEKLLHTKWADLAWPAFTTITDVCRDDLLFEIEAIAAVKR